jgi:hypothetical protein
MKPRRLQISHPSELNGLTQPLLFRKTRPGPIRLSDEFEHPEKERWEADINRYYYACGCSSAANGLLGMLVLGLGLGLTLYMLNVLSLPQVVVLPVAAAIVGAIIGKISGLTTARRRLTRVIHTVQANWRPKDKTEVPSIICG